VGTDAVDELRRLADSYLPKADTAARRAIQLDPNFADGYLSLANVQGSRGKWIDAVDLISKAVSLDPTNTDILRDYGNILAEVGRLKEALEVYQRALALEPFAPAFKVNTATQLYLNGKNEAAIELLKALPPGNGVLLLTRIYAAMGRYDDAAAALTAVPPGNYPSGVLEAAVRLLRMAPTPAASPQALPRLGNMEFVYVYIGAPQRALERYEARLEVGFAGVHWLLWHPSYSPVWKTERFKAYARKAGLVEYWRARGWPEFCRPVGADDFECD
jgi:tetratricopeptide (TPR) repeat protein